MKRKKNIEEFINDQLSRWPLACNNFRALKNVRVKELRTGGLDVKVQFNPARIISSAAKTDSASLKARPCFFCPENRPAEQINMRFDGRKGKRYDILVNPYPIFGDHLVIAFGAHSPQSIWNRYVDMLDLAKSYRDYIFFYNGPKCGASAPDHHHFQGTGRGKMPLENDVDALLDSVKGVPGNTVRSGELCYTASVQDAELFHYRKFTRGIFVLRSRTAKSAAKLFYRLLDCAPVPEGDSEPRFNLFTYCKDGEYRSIIVFRSCHRSHHYFSQGPDHLTMSPGCVDMAGIFITPVKEDFDKLDDGLLTDLLSEVTVPEDVEDLIIDRLTRQQPQLSVGIMSAPEIEFEILSDGAGPRKAVLSEGKIEYDGALYDELDFGAVTPSMMFAEPTFVLYGVTIGKGFHWESRENQKFAGALKIIVENGMLTAVNVIGVEDYLVSVISSEMKSSASLEFLKAHAVISRSWVMSQIEKKNVKKRSSSPDDVDSFPALVTYLDLRINGKSAAPGLKDTDGSHDSVKREYEIMKWYDHSDHINYDVCADDHCQRYQGLTRATGKTVREAIDRTWGEILTYDGEICDARFSKCCGGMTEQYNVCWDDIDCPYLRPVYDEFCGENVPSVLSQVLNDYDLETGDFFRWTVGYGREELTGLVERRTGLKLGLIDSLEPLERGKSGRIWKLRISGKDASLTVGKELEIRRILSSSHLKSSAFWIEYTDDDGNIMQPSGNWTRIVFRGKGWGHGVGLCQIGAAVMASRGYGYRQILEHYYPGAVISVRQSGKDA